MLKNLFSTLLFCLCALCAQAEVIDVTCTNLRIDDYTWDMDMFFAYAENNDYQIALGFNYDIIPGTHGKSQLSTEDSEFYDIKADKYIGISDITAIFTKVGNRYKVEAELSGSDGNTYMLHLSYVTPDTGTDINVEFTEKGTYEYSSYWKSYSISAENDKYILALELYSVYLMGQFETKDFDLSYTYIISQESGEKVAVTDISATFARESDNINITAVMKGDDGNTYHVRLFIESPEIEIKGEVTLNVREAVLVDYTAAQGIFQLGGYNSNNEYYLSVGATNNQVSGSYPAVNLNSQYAYVIRYGTDATYEMIKFIDGVITIESEDLWAKCEGELIGENGIRYTIHMETMEERPEPQIPIRLASITTKMCNDDYFFGYNDDNTLRFITHKEDYDEYSLFTDSLYYNDRQQLVLDEGWQDLDGFKFVNKVEYEYNTDGLLSLRDNYNISYIGGPMNHSARTLYEYDSQQRLTKEKIYWARDLQNPFMILTYSYDMKGRPSLIEEQIQDYDNPKVYYANGETVFEYDSQNRVTRRINYYFEDNTRMLDVMHVYTYDDDDLAQWELVSNGNVVNARSIFGYDYDKLISNILIPQTPEYSVACAAQMTHQPLWEEVWQLDLNTDKLTHTFDRQYNYEEQGTSSVRQLSKQDLRLQVRDNGRTLVLPGELLNIRVIDTAGHTVMTTTTADSSLQLNHLPAGIYIVKASNMSGKSAYLKFIAP